MLKTVLLKREVPIFFMLLLLVLFSLTYQETRANTFDQLDTKGWKHVEPKTHILQGGNTYEYTKLTATDAETGELFWTVHHHGWGYNCRRRAFCE